MKRSLYTAASLFLLVFLSQCGPSTTIVNSWRDPNVVVNDSTLSKFVVCALLRNESTRRMAEDEMVAESKGKAVASYQYFETKDIKGMEDYYEEKMRKDGMHGIVIMRLQNIEQNVSYVPGTYPSYYGGWYGYYGYAYPMYSDPGHYVVDKNYNVETNVYSLDQKKMVWSGVTSTVDPDDPRKMVQDVIRTVKNEMKDQGFMK